MRSGYYKQVQKRHPLLKNAQRFRLENASTELLPVVQNLQTNIQERHGATITRKNNKVPSKTVVVVGGGFSGLAAAYELARTKKYHVILLESSKTRVGGRVFSANDWIHGKITEHGGELVGSARCHPNWHHYAQTFKLDLVELVPDTVEPSEITEPLEEEAYIESMLNFYAMATVHFIMAKIGREAVNLHAPWIGLPNKEHLTRKYDDMSLSEFFNSPALAYAIRSVFDLVKKAFHPGNDVGSSEKESIIQDADQREIAIRMEALRTYEEYETSEIKSEKMLGALDHPKVVGFIRVIEAEFEHNNGVGCHNQSLLFTLATVVSAQSWYVESGEKIYDELSDAKKCHADLNFLNESEMFRCKGGNQALADAFEQNIKTEGGEIKLGSLVQEISFGTSNVIVKYSARQDERVVALNIVADYIVLTVPASKWRNIIFSSQERGRTIDSPLRLPRQPQIGHVMKILFKITKRFWDDSLYPAESMDKAGMHTAYGEFPLAITWETTEWQNPSGQYCFVAFSGGRATSILKDEYREADTPKEFLEWFAKNVIETQTDGHKGFDSRRFLESLSDEQSVDWMDWTDIGISCAAPGEITTIGQKLHSLWNDRMLIAGEHVCFYRAPGFMEGALLSGRNAAKHLLVAASPATKKRIHRVTLRHTPPVPVCQLSLSADSHFIPRDDPPAVALNFSEEI